MRLAQQSVNEVLILIIPKITSQLVETLKVYPNLTQRKKLGEIISSINALAESNCLFSLKNIISTNTGQEDIIEVENEWVSLLEEVFIG